MVGIQIHGCAKSGKSTLAFMLQKFLRRKGFEVSLDDSNGMGIVDNIEPEVVMRTLSKRLDRIRVGTKIEIVTVQTE